MLLFFVFELVDIMASAPFTPETYEKYIPLPDGKTFWDDSSFDNVVKRIAHGKRYADHSDTEFLLYVLIALIRNKSFYKNTVDTNHDI